MLFSHNSLRIFSLDGSLMHETEMPDAHEVYDQQYIRRGGRSYLEVTYYDGTTRSYSGDDGTLISTRSTAPPDPSLHEEFTAGALRITSPLHGTPTAYDATTGAFIRELERDALLTYVTQAGDYVITEYISANGERYGLLLDGQTAQTLAVIPNLSDIIGDRLIIDDRASGTLRETRLHSITQLIEIAREAL